MRTPAGLAIGRKTILLVLAVSTLVLAAVWAQVVAPAATGRVPFPNSDKKSEP